jgi:hypothetical protein
MPVPVKAITEVAGKALNVVGDKWKEMRERNAEVIETKRANRRERRKLRATIRHEKKKKKLLKKMNEE